jgi:diguanylate cyclase (GGDEF)-like protein
VTTRRCGVRLPRHLGLLRVWAIPTAVLLGGAGSAVLVVRRTGPLHAALSMSWWQLAMLFFVTEICVMHLHVRRDAHSLSLSEIPLVLGLLFGSPGGLLLGQLAGAGAALLLHRRQPPHTLIFNCGTLAVSTSIALVTFQTVLGRQSPASPPGWLAVLAGTAAAGAVSALLICAAMAATQQGFSTGSAVRVVVSALLGTAVVTTFAIVVATVMWFQPAAIGLLVLPLMAVFAAYRGYSAQRARTDHLEFLYDASRLLQEAKDVESTVRVLLSRACTMFRAELAEFTLFPGSGEAVVYRTQVGRGHHDEGMVPIGLDSLDEAVTEHLGGRPALLVRAAHRDRVLAAYLRTRGLKDAMVVALQSETRVLGTIMLGNRVGDVNSFTADDLRLFATLASHASIALENGRLERSVTSLLELESELRHRVYYDTATGLPNRLLFSERVTGMRRQAELRGGHAAVLHLDLDDFAAPAGALGDGGVHHVLATIADRLQSAVRPADVVARVGDDEFAVLLNDIEHPADARAVAERLLSVVRHPILMEDESEVQVRASVGVVDDAGQDGDVIDLLEMAMAATRLAQSRGSDRCEVYTADLGVRTGRRRLGRVPRDLTSLAVQRSESAVTG